MGKVKYIFLFGTPILLMLLRTYIKGTNYEGTESMEGKTVIVTGANTGIGFQTALGLAMRKARVILACRNLQKAKAAVKEIREKTKDGELVVKQLDVSSFESVRSFAAEINSEEKKLDVLINNAGIMAIDKSKSVDGHELVFATNHLGPFLLTNLLLEKIKQTPKSRIVMVSSMLYSRGEINFDDLNTDKVDYSMWDVYSHTKLANCLMARVLAKKLEGTDIGVYCLHPGVIATEIGRDVREKFPKWLVPVTDRVIPFFLKTPWEGAQTTLYCAVADEVAGHKGKYYSDCAEKEMYELAYDDKVANKLWEVSSKLTGLEK